MFRLGSCRIPHVSFSRVLPSRTFWNIASKVRTCRDDLAKNGLTEEKHVAEFVRQHMLVEQRNQLLESHNIAPPLVYFLCGHNAGRSQMAEGWLRHFAGNDMLCFSGGSTPIDKVNPQAVEAMREKGVDISNHFPKPPIEAILDTPDAMLFSMGCGESCIRANTVDWPFPDPHGEGIDSVREIRDAIEIKVKNLFDELNVNRTKKLASIEDKLMEQYEKDLPEDEFSILLKDPQILSIMGLLKNMVNA